MNVYVTEAELAAIEEVYSCWSSAQESSDDNQTAVDNTANLVHSVFDKCKKARQKKNEKNLVNRIVRKYKKGGE